MDSNAPGRSAARGLHVAIIMDGNGRWAEARGLSRTAGHVAGAAAVEPIVRSAAALGVARLTLFALSSDNWNRPAPEIDAILELMRMWLASRSGVCVAEGVRMTFIGRRDRLPRTLLAAIDAAERGTAGGTRLHLRLAVDYSSRDAIVDAARHFAAGATGGDERAAFERALESRDRADAASGDVDLLVRSGGEQRLSDFLLWECAWAELVFSPRLWPDFDVSAFEAALFEFHRRERRFGRIAARDVG